MMNRSNRLDYLRPDVIAATAVVGADLPLIIPPPICTLKLLDIYLDVCSKLHFQGVENIQWLESFRLFTALKYLCLDKNFAPLIMPALRHPQLVAEGVTQV